MLDTWSQCDDRRVETRLGQALKLVALSYFAKSFPTCKGIMSSI